MPTPTIEQLAAEVRILKRELRELRSMFIKKVDFRKVLKKYIRHVGSSEGDKWARSLEITPAGMGEYEYREEEEKALGEVFAELDKEDLKRDHDEPHQEQGGESDSPK